MSLRIVPMGRDQANEIVKALHRHHPPVVGFKFALGCVDGSRLVGVAICGRPVARMLDDGWTLEVTRVATDGTRNACSKLYGAAWRVARAMGFCRLVTYTLDSESGASLRGAGFELHGTTPNGREWIEWMNRDELTEAIPPAFSEYLATQWIQTQHSRG